MHLFETSSRPHHIVLALADSRVPEDERQELATAVADALEDWGGEELDVRLVEKPGPNLASGNLHWANGRPRLSSFVTSDSSMIFRLLDQQPNDLAWLREPVEEWENYPPYVEFEFYVKKMAVVNDPAERIIGLIKPIVKNFHKEENLQAAISTTELVRAKYPTGKKNGKIQTTKTKAQLQLIRPSELLARDNDSDTDSEIEYENDVEAPPGDAFDL